MPLAYQEYYTLQEYQYWEGDWELIEGMPYAMSPSPSVTHQTVAFNLASNLKEGLNTENKRCNACYVLLETDWQISNDTVVRPDVMLVCQDIDEKVLVTPELIIEVVSASSTKRDELMKFDLYQREGVNYYILVYPYKHRLKIYYNNKNGFKKLPDYTSGKVNLSIGKCSFTVDIHSIWR